VIYRGNLKEYARAHKDQGIYGIIVLVTHGEFAGRLGWYDDNDDDHSRARLNPVVYLFKPDWTLDRSYLLCLRPQDMVDVADVQKLADGAAATDGFQFVMRDFHCTREKKAE